MHLPDFPDLPAATLGAIAARHGLTGQAIAPLPNLGIFNAIFAVGESVVLRVPRQHPAFVEATRKEGVVVPAARRAGVRTPELLAFDDTLDLLPVPYGLYERVRGDTLELLGLDAAATPDVWHEVGRDLARLHGGVERTPALAALALEDLPDPEPWPQELAEQGWLGTSEARWLSAWLEHLRDLAGPNQAEVLRHGDLQGTNLMVGPAREYLALLDWGACGWGDAAHDFAGVPQDAVPFMLRGYREERAIPDDGTFEARIVRRQLHIALFLLRRPPQPGKSWAERPLGMMLDLQRTLARSDDPRWRRLLG